MQVISLTIRWEEITTKNLLHLDKVLQLYNESFPFEVREPHDTFIHSLQYATDCFPNSFRLIIGFQDEELVAFSTGHYLAAVNTGFIVYIAINPLMRGKGIGSQTLLKMEGILNEDAKLAGMPALNALVLEAEAPENTHTMMEKEECLSRNQFFHKNGFKQNLDLEYVQPPLHNDDKSIPLNLFIKVSKKSQLDKEYIKRIIQAIYHEKYFKVNQIDKEVLSHCFNEMGMSW